MAREEIAVAFQREGSPSARGVRVTSGGTVSLHALASRVKRLASAALAPPIRSFYVTGGRGTHSNAPALLRRRPGDASI